MASPPGPGLVFPEVTAPHESVGGIHDTSGLAGLYSDVIGGVWPRQDARDFFAPPGTKVLAPEAGTIVRLSGHDPSEPPPQGVGGAWGLSEYLRGVSGTTYFITHLGEENVKQGQSVVPGQIIGAVGDYPGLAADHVHIGAAGPLTATDLIGGKHYDLPSVSERGTGSAADAGSVDLGTAPGTKQVSQAGHAVVGAVGSVEDALKFVFSTRFLEIVGGGLLVLIGLVGLMREIGVNVPLQLPAAAAPVTGPIGAQPRRVQKRAGFEPESAERDRREARAARRSGGAGQSDEVPF